MTTNQTDSHPWPAADRWFSPQWFAAWLLLGLVVAFPMVAAGMESFFYRDFGVLALPTTHFFRESIWRGEFPLWNPLSNCGAPFTAQWGPMPLYPGMILCLLGPLPWSLNYLCLGHLFLAGLGMYFLARRWTGSNFAAAVAGWLFVFNGATFSCLLWPNYAVALGWMPWVVLLANRAATEGGRTLLWAAGAAAMQVLSGVPELVVLTWGAVLALQVVEIIRAPGARGRMIWRTALIPILVTGLTAVQILPFLDLLAHSQREPGFTATKWAMPPWGWANLLVPLFHCFETPQGPFFQDGQAFLSSYYPGLAALALASWAVLCSKDWRGRVMAALALLGLVLALAEAGHLYAWLKTIFPALGLARFPVKFVLLTNFCLPLLAAITIQIMSERGLRSGQSMLRPAIISWAVAGVLAVLIVREAYGYPMTYDQPEVTRANAIARMIWLAVAFGALICAARVRLATAARLVFLAVVLVDVLTHTARQNPSLRVHSPDLTVGLFQSGFWQMDHKSPPPRHGEGRVLITPAAEKVLANSTVPDFEQQWIGKRLAVWSHLNLVEQTPKVNGSSTLQIRAQKQVEDLIYKAPITNALPEGLLDFLGVQFLTAPGKVVEWTNRASALPLITAGQRPQFMSRTNLPAQLLTPEFNPREVVFFPQEMAGTITATNRVPAAAIANARCSAQRIIFTVDAPAPCLVVAAQSYYPNWRAYVAGQPVPLWPANHAFQALQVPAGRHEVMLRYEDRRFRLGLLISVLTLLGMIGTAILWHRKAGDFVQPKHVQPDQS